jgi:uncharacterized protein
MDEMFNMLPNASEDDVNVIKKKIKQVVDYIGKYNGMLVAFSGGVDSSTLSALAHRALGNRAVAVTADSQTLPRRELERSKKTAQSIGIRHIIIPYNGLEEPEFAQNFVDRCYHCKSGLFRKLNSLGQELGFEIVADGTNASERTGYRPGHRAALENGILTPFDDLDIQKNEIRKMAHVLGLSIWDKPQNACLATRFPYGSPLTVEALQRVEKAEYYLIDLGIEQCRVRDHNDVARIEVLVEDFEIIMKNKAAVVKYLKELGYDFIALDLEGFRSGSFDTSIEKSAA